ncbi:alkaline ceramidase 2-like isoform X1 [Xenia sp. Carnegie-2017]|uniref:alkaline ceramidase 2-like isoform X1 n=1 Tax=Xenia sp. Carnegie-2017 TaxID=2897299 RepID=UPI001F03A2DA|nr:alkaline ceramidase 2-like isoform X1 [Xenia sp. Carnegie-2017]
MAIHFQRGTAHIDWCEPNYEFSPNIAEFFNTISNCIYFVIPPLNIYLFSEYSSKVGQSFNVVWLLMMVIGASSAYFHATLSLVGQLLDEVAILWVLLAGYTLWTPEWMIKNMGLFKTRNAFILSAVLLAVIATILGFIYPAANAIALMILGAPCVPILWKQIQRCNSIKVVKLAHIGILWWFIAVMLWLSDRLFCDIWKTIAFPYFHCAWHVFILLGSNIACVLGCYFHVHTEHKEFNSDLNFWPPVFGNWGLPYITIRKKIYEKNT